MSARGQRRGSPGWFGEVGHWADTDYNALCRFLMRILGLQHWGQGTLAKTRVIDGAVYASMN